MALNTITIAADTFNSVGPGLYALSTLTFSDPVNSIKVLPAKRSGKTGPTTLTIVRTIEKNVTVGTATERRKMVVSTQFSVPDGFTANEARNATSYIDNLFNQFGTRILMGES